MVVAEHREDAVRPPVIVRPLAAPSTAISELLGGEIAAAEVYRARAKSANTIRAYDCERRQVEAWCDEREFEALPARAEAVATYLAMLVQTGKGDSTIAATGR